MGVRRGGRLNEASGRGGGGGSEDLAGGVGEGGKGGGALDESESVC